MKKLPSPSRSFQPSGGNILLLKILNFFIFRVLGAFWRSIRRIKQTLVFENYDL
jgi:hypothetical protein